MSEPGLARHLARLLPAGFPLMLAASSPVRDWLIWSGSSVGDRPCFSFRGASGIDGTLSLAMGLLALGPSRCWSPVIWRCSMTAMAGCIPGQRSSLAGGVD